MYGVGIDGIHTGMFSAGRTHEIMPFCDLALRLASSFTMYAVVYLPSLALVWSHARATEGTSTAGMRGWRCFDGKLDEG